MEISEKYTAMMLEENVDDVTYRKLKWYLKKGANPLARYSDGNRFPFMAELANVVNPENPEQFKRVELLMNAVITDYKETGEIISDDMYAILQTLEVCAAKGNYQLIDSAIKGLHLQSVQACDEALRRLKMDDTGKMNHTVPTLCHKAAMNGHTEAAVHLFYPAIERYTYVQPDTYVIKEKEVNPVSRCALYNKHYDTCIALIRVGSKLFSDNANRNSCLKGYVKAIVGNDPEKIEKALAELKRAQDDFTAQTPEQNEIRKVSDRIVPREVFPDNDFSRGTY